MTIGADHVLSHLKKTTDDPELRALFVQLGLPPKEPELEDGFGDLVAKEHGITLLFKFAEFHADRPELEEAPAEIPVLSDVQFTGNGYEGGPPYSGELPYGLKFSDSRDDVRARLGPPVGTAMFGIPNEEWNFGERYLTIDFRPDYSSIKKVTVGIRWNLVR